MGIVLQFVGKLLLLVLVYFLIAFSFAFGYMLAIMVVQGWMEKRQKRRINEAMNRLREFLYQGRVHVKTVS